MMSSYCLWVQLTGYLFRGGAASGLDLAALNVQRGRDLGLRAYNHYRRLVGLQPYQDFNQLPHSVRLETFTIATIKHMPWQRAYNFKL